MEKKKRVCPICEGKRRHVLFVQKFAPVKKVMFLKGYSVVRCEDCGFLFADGIPDQKEFDQYYQECSKYEKTKPSLSAAFIERYEMSIEFMERSVAIKGIQLSALELIDIGCATGDFLRLLRQKGYEHLNAVDPSPLCVAYLESQGIPAQRATISELVEIRKYDFIRMNGVLEHIEDLDTTLLKLDNLLKPGGFIYFSVPDVMGFRQTHNCPFQEFSVEHVNYFSVQSLSNLMAKYGFQLMDFKTTINQDYSELETIFERCENQLPIVVDQKAEACIMEYIRQGTELEQMVNEKLKPLVQTQEPIIVWGVGTHTLRQLEVGWLGKCNIKYMVDSNPHYRGAEFQGIPVVSPNSISSSERILISSYFAKASIMDDARNKFHLKNEFILLY